MRDQRQNTSIHLQLVLKRQYLDPHVILRSERVHPSLLGEISSSVVARRAAETRSALHGCHVPDSSVGEWTQLNSSSYILHRKDAAQSVQY
jgi:hypothetical protein